MVKQVVSSVDGSVCVCVVTFRYVNVFETHLCDSHHSLHFPTVPPLTGTVLPPHSLTHSTQHSPSSEANRFSASQEIPRILWNPKVHYRIHTCPPTCPYPQPALSSPYPTSHFPKVRLNIILPSTPGFPKWTLSFRFPNQNPVYASPLPHTRYMPRPSAAVYSRKPSSDPSAEKSVLPISASEFPDPIPKLP